MSSVTGRETDRDRRPVQDLIAVLQQAANEALGTDDNDTLVSVRRVFKDAVRRLKEDTGKKNRHA